MVISRPALRVLDSEYILKKIQGHLVHPNQSQVGFQKQINQKSTVQDCGGTRWRVTVMVLRRPEGKTAEAIYITLNQWFNF